MRLTKFVCIFFLLLFISAQAFAQNKRPNHLVDISFGYGEFKSPGKIHDGNTFKFKTAEELNFGFFIYPASHMAISGEYSRIFSKSFYQDNVFSEGDSYRLKLDTTVYSFNIYSVYPQNRFAILAGAGISYIVNDLSYSGNKVGSDIRSSGNNNIGYQFELIIKYYMEYGFNMHVTTKYIINKQKFEAHGRNFTEDFSGTSILLGIGYSF